MLSVTFYLLYDEYHYTDEYQYTDEYHYAECRYANCHYANRRYAECHYAECRYANCRYAECHGTHVKGSFSIQISKSGPEVIARARYILKDTRAQCYKTFYVHNLRTFS
jgi:hypothetical protein